MTFTNVEQGDSVIEIIMYIMAQILKIMNAQQAYRIKHITPGKIQRIIITKIIKFTIAQTL
jgi:hypothetical protein